MIYDKDGNPWWVSDFHEGWIDVVCDMMAHASPAMREKVKNRVESWVERHDGRFVISGYADRSRAVELESNWWGKHYLYVWLDGDSKPFYVGQAHDDSRMEQFEYKTRSEEFQAKIREGGCHSVMVAKHIPSDSINRLEQNLIAYLVWKGYCLVNKRDIPSGEKLVLWTTFQLSKNFDEVKTRLGHDPDDVYYDWRNAMKELRPVIDVLESVIGVPWEGECAEFKPKLGLQGERLSWGGKTKTYIEWAKEPDVTVTHSTIKQRISKGWDVAEALFTPSWDTIHGSSLEERKQAYALCREQARNKIA